MSAKRDGRMDMPRPTLAHLKQARVEFKRIEPRDFFYWSITRLVSSVLDVPQGPAANGELVRALMMLLTTWNRNYYRFFESRHPGTTIEDHFADLERVITKHQARLRAFRDRTLDRAANVPAEEVKGLFSDFAGVLGRVGAAKCLHLIAPRYFPLWDAAILKGYGLEKGEYRHCTEAERYLAFMGITREQIAQIGNIESFSDNPLKSLDEYNYCRFTKHVPFK